MRITIAYNLRTDDSEKTAELLSREDVDRLTRTMISLGHTVAGVEMSGKPNDVVDRLLASEPDLVFNVAEGTIGSSREAFYPSLYEQLGIPFTGGNASLLHLNLDKHLAKTVLASRGIRVPRGVLITKADQPLPGDLNYPLMIKPNSEGSSKGITQDSVVGDEAAARRHMAGKYPELGTEMDVVIPVVGETDDSFLNDVRVGTCSAQDAIRAINAAVPGPVPQGSVGAGVGMMTCDFAGGVGTSSRVFNVAGETHTIGVLVLSNFGKMRNLTVDGGVVGRGLDLLHDPLNRRTQSEGSIIVVVATDVPLLSSQLGRIAKRAALGLGRVGSHAASSSGEIIVAFSTANRTPRPSASSDRFIKLKCISDAHINDVYEAVIEATEEAVLNAIFCSNGMSGRKGRWAPAIPQEDVIALLAKGRDIHESH